jgi:hypothetical protein
MQLVAYALILGPIALLLCACVAIDERYGLTDRIADTRAGRRVRTLIDRLIDGC